MHTRIKFVALWLLMLFTPLLRTQGGVPQPSYILYGMASDEFGWPYLTNATITLWLNGASNQTHNISGVISPGVNFLFNISLDSGVSGPRYYSKAGRAGDLVSVTLAVNGAVKLIVPSIPLPPIGMPGQIHAVNLTTGIDTVGDGLPDEWKRWIIQSGVNPALKTIFDVKPDGDADGDGVSNLNEYRAGTDPANAADYFYLDQAGRAPNGRIQFEFLSIPGKTYNVLVSGLNDAAELKWEPASYSTSPDGIPQTNSIIGTGHFITLFAAADDDGAVFKAQVK